MPVTKKSIIIFDLDDTLVDTYGLLITPLEAEAARLIAGIEGVEQSSEAILETLLRLRKTDPQSLYARLAEIAPAQKDVVLRAHQQVFTDFSVEKLEIGQAVVEMLQALSRQHNLALLTEGSPSVQQRKIAHLGIAELFRTVMVVDPRAGDSKFAAMQRFIDAADLPPSDVIVVGNRADNELSAARRLGARTIWVRSGEGSGIPQSPVKADATVDDVLAIRDVLAGWDLA